MPIHGWLARALSLSIFLGLLTTCAQAQAPAALVPLQRYGWDDPAGPAGRTTAAQRRLDGGMLSTVVDLAEDRDGVLYVLDRDGCKVVAFDRNGNVIRIIGNGKGQGPGEFARPNSLTLSDAGELFVLDPGQSRVSVFGTDGVLKRTFPVAGSFGFQIRATSDRLYISQYVFRGGAPVVLVYDFKGTLIEKIFTPSEEDVAFGRTGNTYRMAVTRDGQIALAHPNPGTWTLLSAPTREKGHALIGDNVVQAPTDPNGAWSAPAALRGFAPLGDGRALILYDRVKPQPAIAPGVRAVNIYLATVPADGGKTGAIDVGEVGRNLLVSRDGRSFYLTVADPTYQVVRYRLPKP
ncbi:MAG: 6-bladed beta-propeller [Gemmatimonadales bacterium]